MGQILYRGEASMRFISIILDPGRVWTDHGVVDLDRGILMCKCTCGQDADTIAKVLNIQQAEREEGVKALIAEKAWEAGAEATGNPAPL